MSRSESFNDVHVYPVNDLVPHDTETRECVCGLRLEFSDEGCVVIHRAWDERE
jgi:hypothetical protein